MKRWVLLILLIAGVLPYAMAQQEEVFPSRTAKGQLFLSLNLQVSRKKLTDNRFYQTPGLEISGAHYLLCKLALRVSVSGQQYRAQEMFSPNQPAYHQELGWVAGGQVRYNFWELPRFGTAFVESGFSHGRISGQNKQTLNRWEILSIGETLYLQKAGFQKLAIELRGSLQKESLSKKLTGAAIIGFNYYPGPFN